MSAKFTKGPWRIANCGVYGADGKEVVAKGLPLAHGQGGSEANSALILAAPLLYEALEQQLSQWQLIMNVTEEGSPAYVIAEASAQFVHDALRAARGEG